MTVDRSGFNSKDKLIWADVLGNSKGGHLRLASGYFLFGNALNRQNSYIFAMDPCPDNELCRLQIG